jgi:hypothetical protein
MIRNLRNAYKRLGMELIVSQALVGKGGLDDLEDEELINLLNDIHRARECIQDGVGFDDAELIRSTY